MDDFEDGFESNKPGAPKRRLVEETIALAARRKHCGILCLESCLRFDQVDANRNERCKSYQACLDYAASGKWRSFSCLFCDGSFKLLKDA